MKAIWDEENKFNIWLQIELAAAEAMEKLKIIPRGVVKKVKSKGKINVKRILEIENNVKHDVIAFLTSINEISWGVETITTPSIEKFWHNES